MLIDFQKIKKLKGALKGRKVFLLGNGPSVQYEDLEKLSEEVCFAANRFHLCYEKTSFRPKLTFLEDKKMIENHFHHIAEKCETQILVPSYGVPYGRWHNNLILYQGLTQKKEKEIREFSDDLEVGLYFGASVIYGMLQVAAYMEAAEVILYGIDHCFELPKKAALKSENVIVDEGHQNHFISGYRNTKEEWCPPETRKIEEGFTVARNYFDKKGIPIWNATRGGKLEIFQRKSFDSFTRKPLLGKLSSVFLKKPQKSILILKEEPLKGFEERFIKLFKQFPFKSHLLSKEEAPHDMSSFSMVFSFGNPFERIPDRPFSYYVLSSLDEFLKWRPVGRVFCHSVSTLKALDFYDGILVPDSEVKRVLLDYGVKRPIYDLSE